MLTYTIEVKNTFPYAADIVVTDTIPAGTTFVSGSAGYDEATTGHTKLSALVPDAGNVLTWTLKNVPTGAAAIDLRDTVVFENGYTPDAVDVTLGAFKRLDGKTLEADMFTFELVNVNDAETYTAKNAANGTVYLR